MRDAIRFACCLGLLLGVGLGGAWGEGSGRGGGAQVVGAEGTLSVGMAREIEVTFRLHAELPPGSEVHVGGLERSEFAGYDAITISYTFQGQASGPMRFLVSKDGTKLVQMRELAVVKEPRGLVSQGERPARGGGKDAPVLIVGFDDLECPFCAELNATLFPAVLERYKDRVRIVYKDYPSEGHPWAMRAAVDTNCLAKESASGYWAAVDTLHAKAGEIGGAARDVATATRTVDRMIREIGVVQHVDMKALNACVERQDTVEVERSIAEGRALRVGVTPTLFINGAKIDGAVPVELLFRVIDAALVAEGEGPPTR